MPTLLEGGKTTGKKYQARSDRFVLLLNFYRASSPAANFGTTWNNLPFNDVQQLTQYLSTASGKKRRKRQADPSSLSFDKSARLFNFPQSAVAEKRIYYTQVIVL